MNIGLLLIRVQMWLLSNVYPLFIIITIIIIIIIIICVTKGYVRADSHPFPSRGASVRPNISRVCLKTADYKCKSPIQYKHCLKITFLEIKVKVPIKDSHPFPSFEASVLPIQGPPHYKFISYCLALFSKILI